MSASDATEIPQNVKTALDKFVNALRSSLGRELVGIYLHGSLAMGGFNPVSSDIDILVVAKTAVSLDKKQSLGAMIFELSKEAPARGFEVSIITLEQLQAVAYPTPYELHFSPDNRQAFENESVDLTSEKTDPDLAAHFVITKERGICLYGEPITRIFPGVPREHFLDSLLRDAEWSYARIMQSSDDEISLPTYGVLNFCRVLALIKVGLITSKLEGGTWALKNLPKEYGPLIEECMKEKAQSGSGKGFKASLAKKFARYAMTTIKNA